jgi:hypothetical protein
VLANTANRHRPTNSAIHKAQRIQDAVPESEDGEHEGHDENDEGHRGRHHPVAAQVEIERNL